MKVDLSKLGHNYTWALQQMRAGNKVRCSNWNPYMYVAATNDADVKAYVMVTNKDSREIPWVRQLDDMESSNWKHYIEYLSDEEGHGIAWAFDQLKLGNRVMRKAWPWHIYLSMDPPEEPLGYVVRNFGNDTDQIGRSFASLYTVDVITDDWILYDVFRWACIDALIKEEYNAKSMTPPIIARENSDA